MTDKIDAQIAQRDQVLDSTSAIVERAEADCIERLQLAKEQLKDPVPKTPEPSVVSEMAAEEPTNNQSALASSEKPPEPEFRTRDSYLIDSQTRQANFVFPPDGNFAYDCYLAGIV